MRKKSLTHAKTIIIPSAAALAGFSLSGYSIKPYCACLRAVVWLALAPSEGQAIRNACPAVVFASNATNRATGFELVAPILSTIRTHSGYVAIVSNKIRGQVVTSQVYSLDVTALRNRKIDFIAAKHIVHF